MNNIIYLDNNATTKVIELATSETILFVFLFIFFSFSPKKITTLFIQQY